MERPSKGPPYGHAEDCVFFFLKRCTDVSMGDSLFVDHLCPPPPHAAGQMASFSQLVHNE